MARDVADGRFPSVADMVEETGKSISGLVESLLEPEYSNEPIINPVERGERKRQKQQVQESKGLGR